MSQVRLEDHSAYGLKCKLCHRPAARFIGPADPQKYRYQMPICKKHLAIIREQTGHYDRFFWKVAPDAAEEEEIIIRKRIQAPADWQPLGPFNKEPSEVKAES